MRILICCAENKNNKRYTSHDSFIQAFKDIGHEVITCGPVIGNHDGELEGEARDIRVYDKREHPETWTYKEILDKCDKKPDLILQTDPHFYLKGEKPKDIITAYYIVDVHRGASVFRQMALAGKFDYVFLAHKYFMPLFTKVGLNCFWLPRAFDDTYVKEYPEIGIECDISFIGENGLGDKINKFPIYDAQIGNWYHEGPYPPASPQDKYRNWENHNTEYNERAEILYRLSQDFNLRVYQGGEDRINSRGINYAKAICRGKIGINHSLWFDSALRNFEILACRRFLISDMLPYQEELLVHGKHYTAYNHYFLPHLDNFKLEYELIRDHIKLLLKHEDIRKEIAKEGCEFVNKYHTFKERAKTLVSTVEGKVKGYQCPF